MIKIDPNKIKTNFIVSSTLYITIVSLWGTSTFFFVLSKAWEKDEMIIPTIGIVVKSTNTGFIQKTFDDILEKAEGNNYNDKSKFKLEYVSLNKDDFKDYGNDENPVLEISLR